MSADNLRTTGQVMVAAVLVVVGALAAAPAAAQERPRSAMELSGGWVGFGDNGIVSEALIGGTARFYLSPRISVGPEIGYISGDNHSHLMLTGNLTCDLLSPRRGRTVTPFIVAGGGLFQTRESFVRENYTSTEGAYTVGGGVRALVSDRVIVGAEARMGWEAHFRVNGFVGIQLSR